MAKRKNARVNAKKKKFIFEMEGADCRSHDEPTLVQPWMALCSLENWGDEAVTPKDISDGDTGRYHSRYIPLEEIEAVDLFGNVISEERWEKGDFHPDDIDFIVDEDEESVDEWVCPDDSNDCIYVYRNPNPPLRCVFQEKIPEYDKRLDCLPKSESCSWHIACQKDGTHEPRSCLVKPRIPKADRYKNRRVKISPRRTDKLNEFLGDDTCYKTLLPQRVVVVVSQKQTKGKEKFCPLSSSVPIINKPKNEKIPKKRENNGYFNRPSMMRR